MQSSSYDCTADFVPIQDTGYFSKLVNDYLNQDESLKPFFDFELSDQGLLKAIEKRRKYPVDRKSLHAVIKKQYEGLELSEAAQKNLEALLDQNTFTVCSAHQPNLMTGYMYFFYKIIHSVKLATHLKKIAPNDNFVPVFFIGSEDNDFEELNHFKYNGRLFEWQTNQSGAVGMMQSDEQLQKLIEELFSILGPLGINEKTLKSIIAKAYKSGNSISDAKRIFINDFLGEMGVLVLDANVKEMKQQFSNVIKEEILNPKAFGLVQETSNHIQEKYKAQAFFRPINLFYLKENIRERIEKHKEEFSVINTNIRFSEGLIEAEINNNPERFSPNVILRGVYQETILPNVAFIGGGSEVAYWMQLKSVFEYYKVFFPMVVLRQSGLIMDEVTNSLKLKIGLDNKVIFKKTNELVSEIIETEKHSNWSLESYYSELNQWQDSLENKLINLDKNLITTIKSTLTKSKYQLGILEKKINHSIKNQKEIEIKRVESFKAHSFPNDNLQERQETFMQFYLDFGQKLFQDILKHTTVFGDQFLILTYKHKDGLS
ncbi:MAG TPA: bacillithiol biosynthesis cysteine-adding enzyme BshC [Edaphocola sp.]|nr:bacillithiol biosynthesis cysteine-adding enzyme BshC [Edaphocola sp.]